MKVSIRRGSTKNFLLHISPLVKTPDGTVEEYENLPELTEADSGAIYKVLHQTDIYKANSYFKWTDGEWHHIGSDTSWADLGTIHVRLKQGSTVIDKVYPEVFDSVLEIKYTQKDTISLTSGTSATLQIKGVKGDPESEEVSISQEYSIPVLKSLWDEVTHNE